MKKMIYIGILAVGGYVAYRMFLQSKVQQPSSLSPYNTAPNLMGQPSQQYPYKVAPTPRADNSNQPWYQSNRDFVQPQTQIGDQNFLQNVQYFKGAADITGSLTSIWDDLSGMFGTQDDPVTTNSNVVADNGIDWANLGLA